jgi:hypothetical protein
MNTSTSVKALRMPAQVYEMFMNLRMGEMFMNTGIKVRNVSGY